MFSNVLSVVWPRSTEDISNSLLTISALFMVLIQFLLTFQGYGQGTPLLCAVSHPLWSFSYFSSCFCHFCKVFCARMACEFGLWGFSWNNILLWVKCSDNPEYSNCLSLKEGSPHSALVHQEIEMETVLHQKGELQ